MSRNDTGQSRRDDADNVRVQAAELARDRDHPAHVANGDETAYAVQSYPMSFTKGLRHDPDTGLVADGAHFAICPPAGAHSIARANFALALASSGQERQAHDEAVRALRLASSHTRVASCELEVALKERETETEGPELAAALQRIGELSMEVELLRAKIGQPSGPLARKRWR